MRRWFLWENQAYLGKRIQGFPSRKNGYKSMPSNPLGMPSPQASSRAWLRGKWHAYKIIARVKEHNTRQSANDNSERMPGSVTLLLVDRVSRCFSAIKEGNEEVCMSHGWFFIPSRWSTNTLWALYPLLPIKSWGLSHALLCFLQVFSFLF